MDRQLDEGVVSFTASQWTLQEQIQFSWPQFFAYGASYVKETSKLELEQSQTHIAVVLKACKKSPSL